MIKWLRKIFKISTSVLGCIRYVGLKVIQTTKSMEIYIKKDDCPYKSEVTSPKGLAGQLLWITWDKRPYIELDGCIVSTNGKPPTVSLIFSQQIQQLIKWRKKSWNLCILILETLMWSSSKCTVMHHMPIYEMVHRKEDLLPSYRTIEDSFWQFGIKKRGSCHKSFWLHDILPKVEFDDLCVSKNCSYFK